MYSHLLEGFKKHKISKVYCSRNVKKSTFYNFLEFNNIELNELIDCRTLSYFATGICAETNKITVLLCDSNSDFRNIVSGLTEAYYRNLPLFVVVLCDELSFDNKRLLNDIYYETVYFDEIGALNALDKTESDKHIRIVFLKDKLKRQKVPIPEKIDSFIKGIDSVIYISDSFEFEKSKGDLYFGGTLSVVLGASLCDRNKLFFCLITDDELLIEFNVFGNKNFMNNIRCIIVCSDLLKIETIKQYCFDLNINVTNNLEELNNISNYSMICLV